jgi:hypothetical protein
VDIRRSFQQLQPASQRPANLSSPKSDDSRAREGGRLPCLLDRAACSSSRARRDRPRPLLVSDEVPRRLGRRPVSTPRRSGWAAGRAEPASGPGARPPGPLATPSRRWRAAQTARVEARPAVRPAQNGTRRPPQTRRAAETVNVNGTGGCLWSGAAVVQAQAPSAKKATARQSVVLLSGSRSRRW